MRLRGWTRVTVLAGAVAALSALMPAVAVGKADRTYRLAPAVRISAMTAGPEGKLWFAGYRGFAQSPTPPPGGVLGFVAPDGRRIEYASGGGALRGIAVGSDGALWSTEPASARVIRMTTLGEVTSFAVPGAAPSSPRSPPDPTARSGSQRVGGPGRADRHRRAGLGIPAAARVGRQGHRLGLRRGTLARRGRYRLDRSGGG
jgi:hypothetical protein